MNFNKSTLQNMGTEELKHEEQKVNNILSLLHPHTDFPDQVAAAKKHLENIQQYLQQAKVWELIGADKDDSNAED